MFGSSDEVDSAGQPWAGRHFEPNPNADDDGSADPAYIAAITAFRALDMADAARNDVAVQVVNAVREARFLVPLMAVAGEEGVNDKGLTVDKTQELALFVVQGPTGKRVQPVFSSVEAMQRWNKDARPVPAQARIIALAAVSGEADWIVIDPTSDTEFVLRRPVVEAVAKGAPWQAPNTDPELVSTFEAAAFGDTVISQVILGAGDPDYRGWGDELIARVVIAPKTPQFEVEPALKRLTEKWAKDSTLSAKIDSLNVQVVSDSEPA